jgi:6-phosphogluconolactonase/glucosamine-6-phosphate isomerase/deaminase
LIVTGREKRDILRRVIAARPSVECPATLLALNPNAIILADEAAAR